MKPCICGRPVAYIFTRGKYTLRACFVCALKDKIEWVREGK